MILPSGLIYGNVQSKCFFLKYAVLLQVIFNSLYTKKEICFITMLPYSAISLFKLSLPPLSCAIIVVTHSNLIFIPFFKANTGLEILRNKPTLHFGAVANLQKFWEYDLTALESVLGQYSAFHPMKFFNSKRYSTKRIVQVTNLASFLFCTTIICLILTF